MRQSDIIAALRASGLRAAFMRFKTRTAPPYVLLRGLGSENVYADGSVYKKGRRWRVILVTPEDKDMDAEARVEAAMEAAGICWAIEDEYYVDSENLYQVLYEFAEWEE